MSTVLLWKMAGYAFNTQLQNNRIKGKKLMHNYHTYANIHILTQRGQH